jgi:putative tricarboxylic transport membrane protein
MKTKLNVDVITGICILIISAIMFFLTVEFAEGVSLGPEAFPRLITTIMAITGILILLQGIRNIDVFKTKIIKEDLARIAVLVLAAVVYLCLLPNIGYIISTILMLFVALLCFLNKNKKRIILTSLLVPIMIYVIFTKMLNVRLP